MCSGQILKNLFPDTLMTFSWKQSSWCRWRGWAFVMSGGEQSCGGGGDWSDIDGDRRVFLTII